MYGCEVELSSALDVTERNKQVVLDMYAVGVCGDVEGMLGQMVERNVLRDGKIIEMRVFFREARSFVAAGAVA